LAPDAAPYNFVDGMPMTPVDRLNAVAVPSKDALACPARAS
jgi:hypothetical protein